MSMVTVVNKMKLKIYDNKLIKLITTDNDVFEGICTYHSREYSNHEYGKDEECIEIINVLFYKGYIKSIEVSITLLLNILN